MKKALAIVSLILSGWVFAETEKATFGGGCFWCLEPSFESIHGVSSVVAGLRRGLGSESNICPSNVGAKPVILR